jgi:alkyldihydroxyacetonephosphate synthase
MFRDTTRWWGWGSPDVRTPLDERPELAAYLRDALALDATQGLPVPQIADVTLPDPELDGPARRALEEAVGGAERVDSGQEGRLRHATGKSYVDLVRLRSRQVAAAPDAVVHPASAEQVERVLAVAAEYGISVVPFGGGTSVVGGVHPHRAPGTNAVVTLDLRGLDRVIAIEPRSRSAVVEAGILGPALESELDRQGMTLGHFPQSFEFSTLGGWIAARSAGQCSTGYGRIDEMVQTLEIVAPGRRIETAPCLPAATGPCLREVFVGSEGVLGVITRARVRVRPRPERRRMASFFFRDWASGVEAVRSLIQDGPRPTMVRLSDPQETRLLLAGSPRPHDLVARLSRRLGLWLLARRAGEAGPGCLLIMDYEGGQRQTRIDRQRAAGRLRRQALLSAGEGPARSWFAERFRHPYMRDELLSMGALVETLETATTWDRLHALYEGVRDRLAHGLAESGAPGLVLCHLSHAYPQGASLYFTVMARARPGEEVAQWQRLKRAATDEIARQSGALSHHHGIGIDHAPWMERQHGTGALAVLAALKREMDPRGVLNPGKLLGEGGGRGVP